MGKLQSKHDCKSRENPEGGSFAVHALTCQGERARFRTSTHAINRKQEFGGRDLRSPQICTSDCHLEVGLPGRAADREQGHTGTPPPPQEWIFTLHCRDDSGQVTKQGVSRLMHSIFEVMETSVKQPTNGSTALRIKLVLTPISQSDRLSQSDHIMGHTQEVERSDRKYCVDENPERRKHYLDLAGVENCSSKFDSTEVTSQDPGHRHCRHPVVSGENCSATTSQGRGLSFLRSLRGGARAVGGGGGSKSTRFHGKKPQPLPQPQPSFKHTRIKHFRSRVQETAGSPSRPQLFHHQPPGLQARPGEERELFPSQTASYGGLVSLAQRHHLHHHEHHHHHYHY